MLERTHGNLLEAPVEALVNTVNTVGVMGKGIALQFKRAYPQVFKAYAKACEADEVQLGKMQVVGIGGLAGGPRFVINFPTKGHWKANSRIEDIASGLNDLKRVIRENQIRSIALPPLGCGNGGLDWGVVFPMIEHAFADMPDVRVLVYGPAGAPAAASMPVGTERPKMTEGRAALLVLCQRYLDGLMDTALTLLEAQKLMYFLQASGHPLQLQYVKGTYGPYAPNLRHVLNHIEGHFVQGFGDGREDPTKELVLVSEAVAEAGNYLKAHPSLHDHMDRVGDLIEGFEDSYGMELLASVHWVMHHEEGVCESPEAAIAAVHAWNDRKRATLQPRHIIKAWERLKERGWACPN